MKLNNFCIFVFWVVLSPPVRAELFLCVIFLFLCAGGCEVGGLCLPHDPSAGPHQYVLNLFCVCVSCFCVLVGVTNVENEVFSVIIKSNNGLLIFRVFPM